MLQKVKPAVQLKDMGLFRQQCYINGQWVDADDKSTLAVYNPADGQQIGTVPGMGVAETRRAIEAAHAAWPAWRAKTAKERAAVLRKWFDIMMANQEDLAVLMTVEQGKPLAESRGEIGYGASFIEWFAEEGKRVYGDTIPAQAADRRIVVIKQPIGVCAAVTPWNFPNAMITRKAGPALAAGCTMVIKPASMTPYSALALCELAERAGIPKGVLSVVTGAAGPIGKELTTNPLVRKFTFTGSTEVGKKLMEQCASTVKKVSLELGGNAPFIVFDDADLDAAVEGALASKFRNTGQTCVCANRIYVQDGVYEKFAGKLSEKVSAMKVGNGLETGVVQGPLIEKKAVEKVEEHIADALDEGRARRHRRQAAREGRPVLPADRVDRRHQGDEDHPRGDLRPGRAALPLQDRSRSCSISPTTPSSVSRPTSTAATSAASGAWPKGSSPASSASTSGSSPPRSRRSAA